MNYIAVFCGASMGNSPIYQEATIALGKWIAENHDGLVYGGGKVGLMGVLADQVLASGAEVIGVIPEALKNREMAHERLTELHVVANMHERKAQMIASANVYIAMPGGPGTLEEITEVISWGRIGEHTNPCILYNVNGYYDLLGKFYDKMVEEGFLTPADRDKILISESLDEIDQFIASYVPPMIRTYK
ncbi:NA recombination-mediator protein A superfamily protein [Listeria grandensis FSL F6-0971]|uniref:Cytokinin riboside 5'-monophosphate phosphoribohydrolase n=1 Tax=Listeria grandensis FSL F6-0971 TaxID=1265819 RepID=W7BCK9_9LIST|nr:TIGR00730 family Rossman fold protein [Listeria grandensis]EUJ22470.1 NA recombination-mediator protein A superfamily protein [Listeria grandensis FSL F6-0971]